MLQKDHLSYGHNLSSISYALFHFGTHSRLNVDDILMQICSHPATYINTAWNCVKLLNTKMQAFTHNENDTISNPPRSEPTNIICKFKTINLTPVVLHTKLAQLSFSCRSFNPNFLHQPFHAVVIKPSAKV